MPPGSADQVAFTRIVPWAPRPGLHPGCRIHLNSCPRQDGSEATRPAEPRLHGRDAPLSSSLSATPTAMLVALHGTLAGASEFPVCRVAGPWARHIPFNHRSYLFNFGTLTETNATDWIEMAHQLGFNQIDTNTTEIVVNESTTAMRTITGFFEHVGGTPPRKPPSPRLRRRGGSVRGRRLHQRIALRSTAPRAGHGVSAG